MLHRQPDPHSVALTDVCVLCTEGFLGPLMKFLVFYPRSPLPNVHGSQPFNIKNVKDRASNTHGTLLHKITDQCLLYKAL